MADLPVKVEAKIGEASTDKVVDAAADAFSPATEFLGFLGDAIRLGRVELAARITRRAKAIADANGLVLKAPPLKFLVPFYEKASIGDEDDTTLIEMWEQLLLSASTDYSHKHLRYTQILSEMSGDQAILVQKIATSHGGALGTTRSPDESWVYLIESSFTSDIRLIESDNREDTLNVVKELCCHPGVFVYSILVSDGGGKYSFYSDSDNSSYIEEINMEILRSMGILEEVNTDFIETHNDTIDVAARYYYISHMGYDFLTSCRSIS